MKQSSLRQRIRDLDSKIQGIVKLLPYLKDTIVMTSILVEKGIVTQDELKEAYQKISQPDDKV